MNELDAMRAWLRDDRRSNLERLVRRMEQLEHEVAFMGVYLDYLAQEVDRWWARASRG